MTEITLSNLEDFRRYMLKNKLVTDVILNLNCNYVNILLTDYSYSSIKSVVDDYCYWQDSHADIPFFIIDIGCQ